MRHQIPCIIPNTVANKCKKKRCKKKFPNEPLPQAPAKNLIIGTSSREQAEKKRKPAICSSNQARLFVSQTIGRELITNAAAARLPLRTSSRRISAGEAIEIWGDNAGAGRERLCGRNRGWLIALGWLRGQGRQEGT